MYFVAEATATAGAIQRFKFENERFNNTPVRKINTQFLQSSQVHTKMISLLQYTPPPLMRPKIGPKVQANQLIMQGLLINSGRVS